MPYVYPISSDAEREACLRLRREVFIDEQGVSEVDELDDLDDVCVHLLALPYEGAPLDEACGTARLWPRPDGVAKAQRVAVRARVRGQGVGRALMQALEEEARRRGFREVVLGAQLEALPFYRALSYEPYGDVFDDAGIPHRMMRKRL